MFELMIEHISNRFETEDEAVKIANATNFGLAGKSSSRPSLFDIDDVLWLRLILDFQR